MDEKINIRFANAEDVKNVFELSNDDTVRQNSIHKEKICWEQHIKWYNDKINSNNSIFYIVEYQNDFAGYCRLDKDNQEWIVTIHIVSKYRNIGLGTQVIQHISKINLDKIILAYIKETNITSYKMFINNNFSPCSAVVIDGINYNILKFCKKTILLSPVGGQAIYGIIEYFKNKNYKIIGIDLNKNSIGRHFVDEFYAAPPIGNLEYVDFVLNLIKTKNIDIYMSWLDMEVLFWNENFNKIPKDLLGKFYINFMNDYEVIFNKTLFSKKLSDFNLLTPDSDLKEKKYPLIAKPNFGSGSKGVIKILNEKEYLLIKNYENYLIQNFISGIEYTVDFIANNGKLLKAVVRKRNISKGICLDGEVVDNDDIYNLTSVFVSKFNISGLNNIQFIKNEVDNNYYIIDFNPRPSGTIMLSIMAGVDFFNNWIELKSNTKITEYNDIKLLKFIRYYKEYYYV